MGWGSVLVGYTRPEVSEAVARQAALGANFACVNKNSPRRDEVRWHLRTGEAERQRVRPAAGMACNHMEHRHRGGTPRNESACARPD